MKRIMVALVVVAVLLSVLATPVMAGVVPDPQTWYLDSVPHPSGLGLIMDKQGSGAQSGSVDIASGQALLWVSNGSAGPGGVTFPWGDYWLINLKTADWHSLCGALLGQVDSAGNFDDFSELAPLSYRYLNGAILEIKVQLTTDIVVLEGNYLALKVINYSGLTQTITTTGADSSFISAPGSIPNFPVPEMAACVLLGVGLAGVGTFIIIRRKQGQAVPVK